MSLHPIPVIFAGLEADRVQFRQLKMKASTSSGFLPLIMLCLALFSVLGSAWPQARHRHGLLHRDRKNRNGGKDGTDVACDSAVSTSNVLLTPTPVESVVAASTVTPVVRFNTTLFPTGNILSTRV